MKSTTKIRATILLALFPMLMANAAEQLTVQAVNKLQIARTNQTIELSATQLAPLGIGNLELIHIRDSAGKELLCQAVDTNFDASHTLDEVIFQSDFAPGETKSFTITVGKKQKYKKDDYKAYGRFVRERFDDFAWKNDLIAHRTYGKALETWKREPLTSSAIDIWSKRTSRMVIDEWYMVDNYHADTGDGCDVYSAGSTRGDGGSGFWSDSTLFAPKNFVMSRVLANGPIRVLFELDYDAFDVNGANVSETVRIALDAGSQLDHYQVYYKSDNSSPLAPAVGLKKVNSEEKEYAAENGSLTIWEPMDKNMGMQGVAVIVDPKMLAQQAEDKSNNLLVLKPGTNNSFSYWAGFTWDRAGHITTPAAWKKYVANFAQGIQSPIEVCIKNE